MYIWVFDMATTKDLKTYLYKLLPDYSIIDYAEYLYWSSHQKYDINNNGNEWFNIFQLNKDSYYETDYYRMLVVSDNELDFENHPYQKVYNLPNYQDRFVYVIFSDDEHPQPIKLKFSSSDEELKSDFVTTVRF